MQTVADMSALTTLTLNNDADDSQMLGFEELACLRSTSLQELLVGVNQVLKVSGSGWGRELGRCQV